MKTLIFIILSILIGISSNAQQMTFKFDKNDAKFFIQNSISSGLTSSLVACFNKPKHQSLGKTFTKSFLKGFLGGSINYSSKKLLEYSSYKNTYNYDLPSRFINSIGNSIIMNGANNEKLLSSYDLNIFFLNVHYNKSLKIRIDPYTTGAFVVLSFSKDYSFNLKNTLLTGAMIFDKKWDGIIVDGDSPSQFGTSGLSFGNTVLSKTCKQKIFVLEEDTMTSGGYFYKYDAWAKKIINFKVQTTSHELIHTYQYAQYSILNPITTNKINKLINWNFDSYLSINPNFCLAYLMANISGYDNNIFESEANYFGKSTYYHKLFF